MRFYCVSALALVLLFVSGCMSGGANDDGVALVVSVHGSGSVTSSPAGLTCDGDACTLTAAPGTTVTLTATSDADSAFAGWVGACSGSAATCTVELTSSEQSATATFVPASTSLVVMFAGSGSGGVTSVFAGIACTDGAATGCSAALVPGTSVALTATPAASSAFAGWSGGCTGFATTCTTTIGSGLDTVTAHFEPAGANTLLVDVDGQGTVTATPGNIACVNGAGTCAASLPYGTTATLIASPADGWQLDHWDGACGGAQACQATIDEPVTVGATFTQIDETLAVVLAGTGSGKVVATSSACSGETCFDCPATGCSATLGEGAIVTLTASAGSDSEFAGWSGPCSGIETDTCTIAINHATTVHATFELMPETLTVDLIGSGVGNVSATGLIACGNGGATCSATVAAGTPITLIATPSATSRFVGWSGPCTGTSPTCVVELHDATTVTAAFEVLNRTLVVEFPQIYVGGTLSAEQDQGTVVGTGSDGSTLFECAPSATTCMVSLPVGSQITLTGTPSGGASLHWGPNGGPCSGSAPCTFTFTAATDEVDAVFARVPISELDVAIEGNGGDTVDIYSGGVDALRSSGRDYIETGAQLDLYADASGSAVDIFDEWEGSCVGPGADCAFTLSADTSVLAVFESVGE